MSLMTLDEAIQHCRDKENCSQCGQEHKRLREWLEELKKLRSQYNLPKPHGRLIDADRLYETIEQMEGFGTIDNENDVVLSAVEVLTAIDEAPTIIEAEE